MAGVCPQDDTRSIDELVNMAFGAPDEHAAWDAVCALHWRGTEEVLQTAVDSDTRGEALVGLANRGDIRAVDAVVESEQLFAGTDHLIEAKLILAEKGLL